MILARSIDTGNVIKHERKAAAISINHNPPKKSKDIRQTHIKAVQLNCILALDFKESEKIIKSYF